MEMGTSSLRVAIALNNAGITLLQRGAFTEALEALHYSVVAARLATCEKEESENARIPDILRCKTDIQEALQRAQQTVAATATHRPQTLQNVSVLSDDEGLSIVQTVLCSSILTEELYLIRINPFEDLSSRRSFDIESAIILLNFSSLHRCLGRISDTRREVLKHLSHALELTRLSYTVLPSIQLDSVDQSSRAFLVACLAMKSLLELSIDLCMEDAATNYLSRLITLQDDIADLSWTQDPSFTTTTPAAA